MKAFTPPAKKTKTPPTPPEPEMKALGAEIDPEAAYESVPASRGIIPLGASGSLPTARYGGKKPINAAHMERVWRDLRIANDSRYFHGAGWDLKTKRHMKLIIDKIGGEQAERVISTVVPKWDKFADYVLEAEVIRIGTSPSVLKLYQCLTLAVQFSQEYAMAKAKPATKPTHAGPSLAAYVGGGVKDGSS